MYKRNLLIKVEEKKERKKNDTLKKLEITEKKKKRIIKFVD